MGVYNPTQDDHFRGVKRLRDQGRVQCVAEADYRPGSTANRWISTSLEEMAQIIVRDRERALAERVSAPAGHVT